MSAAPTTACPHGDRLATLIPATLFGWLHVIEMRVDLIVEMMWP
jgi:hypothetical protein